MKAVTASSPVDPSTAAADATDAGDGAVLELEMDELNQHECMSSLVSLLRHMHLNNVTPAVEQVATVLMLSAPQNVQLSCFFVLYCFQCLVAVCWVTGGLSGLQGDMCLALC